jgi:hypothetical protein
MSHTLNNEYKIGINDHKIWRKDQLIMYLYDCMLNDTQPILTAVPEASSFEANGLYWYLDNFCEHTGYNKSNITIRTGNMIECHPDYQISRVKEAWYEIPIIHKWLWNNMPAITGTPAKHFGHFIGKANWNRLWVAAVLHSRYASKSFQTFNGGLGTNYLTKDTAHVDYIGLEDLVKRRCDILPEVIEFLKTCPRVIAEDLEFIADCNTHINQEHHYPIQLPANLNILKYYNDIFVDIVHESYLSGTVFFCTEKTWRPIIAHRPFITAAGQGHLANMRRLGFRTFGDFWDESYDDLRMTDRIQGIVKVLATISSWAPAELVSKLEEMQPILEHNFKTFLQLTQQKIADTFNV